MRTAQVRQDEAERFGEEELLSRWFLYRLQGSYPELHLDNCTESDFEKGQLAERNLWNGVLGFLI